MIDWKSKLTSRKFWMEEKILRSNVGLLSLLLAKIAGVCLRRNLYQGGRMRDLRILAQKMIYLHIKTLCYEEVSSD